MEELLAPLEGKYELLEKLQEGGMGAIYKVRHRLLDELRVVKVIRPQLQQDEGIEVRFQREAQAAARLNHPNIARIFDFTLDKQGVACIVMEYIPGLTLGDLIRSDVIPPIGLGVEIAQQCLQAIGYIHRQKILHRDISPDNLMLSLDVEGKPLVKLIDLGLAKAMEGGGSQLTGAGIFVGKFRYAAPELFEAEGQGESQGSDLYAFALVLYEMLTGRFPISGDNPSSLIAGHLFREPLDFEITDAEGRIPGSLRAAILRGLAKRLEERFTSADTFAAALPSVDLDLGAPAVHRVLELVRRPGNHRDAQFGEIPGLESPLASDGATSDGAASVPPELSGTAESPPSGEPSPSRGGMPKAPGASVATERIEALVMEGDLAAARVALDRLPAEEETAALRELRFRLDEIETIANRPRVRDLLERARQESAADRSAEALGLLEEAHRLGPADDQVAALLSATRRAAERQREAREREQLVNERAALVAAHLEAERFDEAARELNRSEEIFGPTERFHRLREQLEAGLGEARDGMEPTRTLAGEAAPSPRARARELVEEARRHARGEEFESARQLLMAALELDPGHTEAAESLVAVRACLEAQRQETEQTAALERTLTDIRHLLGDGHSGEALASLEQAAATFGDRKELNALRFQAAEARMDGDESEAVTTLIATGTVAREGAVSTPREETLEEALAEIQGMANSGEAGRALGVLQRAVERHGDLPVLRELRAELGRALLDQDEALSLEFTTPGSAAPEFSPSVPANIPPQPSASELADLTLGGRVGASSAVGVELGQNPPVGPFGLGEEDPVTEAGQAVALGTTATVRPEVPQGPMELGFGGPSSGTMPVHTTQRRALPGRQTSRNMVLTAVVLVTVLVGLVLVMGRMQRSRDTPPVESPPEDVAPVDLTPGFLILDASPWAEIVEIVDLAGGNPPPLVPSHFTPVMLTLPAGRYRLTLRDPSGAETRDVEVEIKSGARHEERQLWREVDARQYLRAAGY